MTSYIGQAPGLTARSVYRFVATQGQTTFSGLDANGLTLGYTRDALDVYINGNLVTPSTDFTATDGSSIVLSQPLAAGDEVIVIANSPFSQADHYTKDAADNRFAQFANLGFRNKIINGGFDVWQRGTPRNLVIYGADRWFNTLQDYTGGGCDTLRVATTPGEVQGEPPFYGRIRNTNVTTGAGGAVGFEQRIEDVRTFAGKTVMLSFDIRRSVGTTVAVGWMQVFGSGGSAAVGDLQVVSGISSAWDRKSVTLTLPSVTGKTVGANSYLSVLIWPVYKALGVGDLATNETVDVTQVQLEEGSVATPFERRPLIIEETLCMRYARRISAGSGAAASSSVFEFPVEFVPPMRAAPSFTPVGTFYVEDPSTTVYPQSSPTVTAQYTNTHGAKLILGNFSGLSVDIPYFVAVYLTDNHIFADAEL